MACLLAINVQVACQVAATLLRLAACRWRSAVLSLTSGAARQGEHAQGGRHLHAFA